MPIKNYHRPADWDAARAALRDSEALLLGPRVPIPPHGEAASVTDLSRLELNYITVDSQIHIGALTPLQALAESTEVGDLLNEAARLTTHYGLRNVATIGGLLLAESGPPEILLALLALGAEVVIQGENRRKTDLDYFLGGEGALASGEMLSQIVFSPGKEKSWALERVTRTPRDEAIVAVAATLQISDGICRFPRLTLSGINSRPQRMFAAERMMEFQPISSNLIRQVADTVMNEANPIGDYRGSAEYRKAMAGVLVKRALTKVAE